MSGDLPPWTRGDLSIPAALLEAIEAHAREAYPSEACGFVIGPAEDAAALDEAVREANEADKYHRLDPERFPRTSNTYFKINELRAESDAVKASLAQVRKENDEAKAASERMLSQLRAEFKAEIEAVKAASLSKSS